MRIQGIRYVKIEKNISKPLEPKLGYLGAQKWAKECPDQILSFIQFCWAPKIMGI